MCGLLPVSTRDRERGGEEGMTMEAEWSATCPLPVGDWPTITMAHGGGGKGMRQLLARVFLPAFRNPLLDQQHDGAVLTVGGQRLAFTTDSYVVRPLFFPGGDIGALAVNGTVNDLAMCGARPRWISAGFILEEGLPMETLRRVVSSMQQAAVEAGVELVTGDTKVVDRGKGDGMYLNTAGVGVVEHNIVVGPARVQPGDVVLLSGDVGRHGMAILSVREGLAFEGGIESDCAPLARLVAGLLDAGIEVHCLRDLTRGGLAAALNEIAETARVRIDLDEAAVPVREEVRGACEMLGLDPLYVANEGRFVAFVAPRDLTRALAVLHGHPLGQNASFIGSVVAGSPGLVTLRSRLGVARILDLPSGDPLPRIC